MAVDEPGHRHLAARIDALARLDLRQAGAHGLDDAVSDDDRRVLLERNAFLIVMHEDGAPGDDEIGSGVFGHDRNSSSADLNRAGLSNHGKWPQRSRIS